MLWQILRCFLKLWAHSLFCLCHGTYRAGIHLPYLQTEVHNSIPTVLLNNIIYLSYITWQCACYFPIQVPFYPLEWGYLYVHGNFFWKFNTIINFFGPSVVHLPSVCSSVNFLHFLNFSLESVNYFRGNLVQSILIW